MWVSEGTLWTAALTLVVSLLFLLTLLPGIREYRLKTDVLPLRVVREHDGNIINFAHGFSKFIETRFGDQLRALAPAAKSMVELDNGDRFLLLGSSYPFVLYSKEKASQSVKSGVVAAGSLEFPGQVLFEAEVFCIGNFRGGTMSAYRAVLAQGDMHLGDESVVLRWVHANGELTVGPRSELFGRASSLRRIVLGDGVKFERLHSAEIGTNARVPVAPAQIPNSCEDWQPERLADFKGGLWRINGDLNIPARSVISTPLVVDGNIFVGEGSLLSCAIKSNGGLTLGSHCTVNDAVVACKRVEVGTYCRVKGPVISEVELILRKGCVIGSPMSLATVSAPRIVIELGATVHGTIWARSGGEVRGDTCKST